MKKFLFSFMLIAGLLTLSGCGQKEDENALVILNYGKYIEPDVIQQFEKETGITIKYEEYESPEEMYTKYKAGSIKYDLICTSDYMIQKLINEGEVLEMDYDNIPLYENIDPTYVEFSKAFALFFIQLLLFERHFLTVLRVFLLSSICATLSV